MELELIAVVVDDYDTALAFFVDKLGFDLVEDSPALSTAEGRPKRWVVVTKGVGRDHPPHPYARFGPVASPIRPQGLAFERPKRLLSIRHW